MDRDFDNVIFYRDVFGGRDAIITIRRTQKFLDTAQAVSDYLRGLDIPAEQNNKLVELMVAHTLAAEESGFLDGIRYGCMPSETGGKAADEDGAGE